MTKRWFTRFQMNFRSQNNLNFVIEDPDHILSKTEEDKIGILFKRAVRAGHPFDIGANRLFEVPIYKNSEKSPLTIRRIPSCMCLSIETV